MGVLEESSKSRINLLQINPRDNVAVAVVALAAGYREPIAGVELVIQQDVSLGAKVALHDLPAGEKIIKFGEPIGSSTSAILAGEYVHTHNLQSDYIPTASHETPTASHGD